MWHHAAGCRGLAAVHFPADAGERDLRHAQIRGDVVVGNEVDDARVGLEEPQVAIACRLLADDRLDVPMHLPGALKDADVVEGEREVAREQAADGFQGDADDMGGQERFDMDGRGFGEVRARRDDHSLFRDEAIGVVAAGDVEHRGANRSVYKQRYIVLKLAFAQNQLAFREGARGGCAGDGLGDMRIGDARLPMEEDGYFVIVHK